jgi:hypothetical protein
MRYRQSAQWHAALQRGVEEQLTTTRLRYPPEYVQGGFQSYLVEASSKNGSVYHVQHHQNSTSNHVICTCKAGEKRQPCKHAALVLYHAGVMAPQVGELIEAA